MQIHRTRSSEKEEWAVYMDPRTLRELGRQAERLVGWVALALLVLSVKSDELPTFSPFVASGHVEVCMKVSVRAELLPHSPNAADDVVDYTSTVRGL